MLFILLVYIFIGIFNGFIIRLYWSQKYPFEWGPLLLIFGIDVVFGLLGWLFARSSKEVEPGGFKYGMPPDVWMLALSLASASGVVVGILVE